jgi:hypothetical protein
VSGKTQKPDIWIHFSAKATYHPSEQGLGIVIASVRSVEGRNEDNMLPSCARLIYSTFALLRRSCALVEFIQLLGSFAGRVSQICHH